MAIKYYPLTRIKANLYTRGNVYQLNGKPYTGRYYLTYDGKAYTGVNPILGTNQQLTLNQTSKNLDNLGGLQAAATYTVAKSQNTATRSSLNDSLSKNQLQEIQPYYPVVTEAQYQVGSFTRYFAKRITGPGYIFEISQTDYVALQSNDYPEDFRLYESVSLIWQLVGPLRDVRVSQYQIKGGVSTTNKRITEQKALSFKGLVEFIGGDYTKFARITP
jgi:hypothetical protein